MALPAPRLSVAQILSPRSVAVVGASDDLRKFGARVLDNVLHGGFPGAVVPVNPNRERVQGLPAVPSLSALAEPVEVAVIAVPRPHVLSAVEEAAENGIGCCILITAGFSEVDEAGRRLEETLVGIARRAGMRLIGPNCLGLINTHARLLLNSSPAMRVTPLRPGHIGFVTQSGALMATVYNRCVDDQARFSHAISIGNQADLELADFVELMAEDASTRVVTLYVEGFRSPRRFLRAVARCRAAGKPVLLVKAGLSDRGARVTRSHTASLAGSRQVLEAVCREHGVRLMDDIRAMIQTAELVARAEPPRERGGICVISGSGGAAALTADRLSERALPLAEFGPRTWQRLEAIYEPTQLGNPLDVGALREKSFYDVDDGGLAIAAADASVCVSLVVMTTSPRVGNMTRCMVESAQRSGKPALFVFMQGSADDGGRAICREADMLLFETLAEAIAVLEGWWGAGGSDPEPATSRRPPGAAAGEPFLAVEDGPLGEHRTKEVLRRYAIPTPREALATSLEEALRAAQRIGYPVALKASAAGLVHKSDVGGVHLGLAEEAALRAAWGAIRRAVGPSLEGCLVCEMVAGEAELIVGVKRDAEFGPMIACGFGGIAAELVADVRIAPAPVSPEKARALLSGLRLWPLLAGARGRAPLDVAALCDIVSRVSWLAVDAERRLAELDLNPVLVGREGARVLDASAVLETRSEEDS